MSTGGLHERLAAMAAELRDERVALRELMAAHGQAAQGAWLVLLALPCLLPIPGTGTVLSFGLAVMAWLVWRGPEHCELPARVGNWELSADAARRVLHSLSRCYGWAARLSRERWAWCSAPTQRHWQALLVACMALLIFLPIPFGNVLPATALVILGLGLVFRDGWAVLASVAVGVCAVGVTTALAWGVLWAGQSLL
jgi:hypothetical protein